MATTTKAQRRRAKAKADRRRVFGGLVPPPVTIGENLARCCECAWFARGDLLRVGEWDRLHFKAEGHSLLNGHAVGMYRHWQQPGDPPVEVVAEEKAV